MMQSEHVWNTQYKKANCFCSKASGQVQVWTKWEKKKTCLLRYETSYHCTWFITLLRKGKNQHKANKKSNVSLYRATLQLSLDGEVWWVTSTLPGLSHRHLTPATVQSWVLPHGHHSPLCVQKSCKERLWPFHSLFQTHSEICYFFTGLTPLWAMEVIVIWCM